MMNGLTQKQETFAQNLFKGMTQREAWIQAGYSSKYAPAIIDTNACNLANLNKIQIRWQELNQAAKSALIATEIERRERLSVFVREDIYTKFGITRQGNIQAIDLLNKMEKLYTDGANVNIDNRTLIINVNSEETKDLTERLLAGERTGKE